MSYKPTRQCRCAICRAKYRTQIHPERRVRDCGICRKCTHNERAKEDAGIPSYFDALPYSATREDLMAVKIEREPYPPLSIDPWSNYTQFRD